MPNTFGRRPYTPMADANGTDGTVQKLGLTGLGHSNRDRQVQLDNGCFEIETCVLPARR